MRARFVASCVVIAGLSAAVVRPVVSSAATATAMPAVIAPREAELESLEMPPVPCEVLRDRILGRAMDPAGSPNRLAQEGLVRDVRAAARLPGAGVGETCAATVIRELAAAPRCGSAADLVSSAAAEVNALDPHVIATFGGGASACQRAVISGMAQLRRPDANAADAVMTWALHQRDPLHRAGGLVVLGSIAHTLDSLGEQQATARANKVILQELQHLTRSEAVWSQRLEAAGNAGCELCLPAIIHALSAASPELRRSAIGALRFVADVRAPTALCDALLDDPEANVRDQAAWALEWGHAAARERVACLTTSAARDPIARVRQTSALSLTQLATSDSIAESAILHLSSDEYDANVRRIALAFLDGDRHDLDAAPERTE
jgi:hypothetical protein